MENEDSSVSQRHNLEIDRTRSPNQSSSLEKGLLVSHFFPWEFHGNGNVMCCSGTGRRTAAWEWEGIGTTQKPFKPSRRSPHCAALSYGQLTKLQAVQHTVFKVVTEHVQCAISARGL